MASICNYSHPEQQITEGLVRNGSGTLFPYNPEMYKLASSYYGPGAMICWYLLMLSVLINWALHEQDDDGYKRPGITNDLLAAMAYPAFAATDALRIAMEFLGTEYRALAIFCLQYPYVELDIFGVKFNETKLDLHSIPSDILSLGQHSINMTGPLCVCYMFAVIIGVGLLLNILQLSAALHLQPTKCAMTLIKGIYGYVGCFLLIIHLSLGDIWTSLFLSLYGAFTPLFLIMISGSSVVISVCILGGIFIILRSLVKRDRTEAIDALKGLGACLIIGFFCPGIMILVSHYEGRLYLPDLGISVIERDQLAAILGGIVTLCFTLGYGLKNSKRIESEEMQTLTSEGLHGSGQSQGDNSNMVV